MPRFITLSAVPFETIQCLLTLGGYGLLFLIMWDLASRYELKWLPVWPLLVIAAFESGLGMLQTGSVNAAATGTYENRDHYAGLLEMVLPLAVMYAVAILKRNPKRHESPAGPALKASCILAIAALILIAIIHSLSRMGFSPPSLRCLFPPPLPSRCAAGVSMLRHRHHYGGEYYRL